MRFEQWWKFVAGGFSGRRLAIGAAVGVLVGLAVQDVLRLPQRVALGWIVAVILFLLLTALAVGTDTPEEVRRRAQQQDSRRWIILILVVVAAAVSLWRLGASFGKETGETAIGLTVRLVLAALTILASWTLTHPFSRSITLATFTATTRCARASRTVAESHSPVRACRTTGTFSISRW